MHSTRAHGLSKPWRYDAWWRGTLEIFGMLGAYAAYEWTRAQVGTEAAAFRNAKLIVEAEKRLHLLWEVDVQQYFLHHKSFVQFLNIYYGTLHFIVPIVVLVMLWFKTPSQYSLWRNRVAAATIIALLGFWLWPLMPPRLLPAGYGFVDTDALFGGLGVLNQGDMKDTNLYAAMPSLHVGWAIWCAAAAMVFLKSRWARIAVWIYPAFTFATVTATGNHYWLDGFGGIAVDAVGYVVGTWVTIWIHRFSMWRKSRNASDSVLSQRPDTQPVMSKQLSQQG